MNDTVTAKPISPMDAIQELTMDELTAANGGRAAPKGRTDVIKVMAATAWEPTTDHR